jgi:hypothetical protein
MHMALESCKAFTDEQICHTSRECTMCTESKRVVSHQAHEHHKARGHEHHKARA